MGPERELGIMTLLVLSILIIAMEAISIGNGTFYLLGASVLSTIFLAFTYLDTVVRGRPSTSLPGIIFLINLFSGLLFIRQLDPANAMALALACIIGIIASSIRIYKKQKKRRLLRKREEIDKELDDPWKETPHIIYETVLC